ncbi:MAG: hypothetical protein DSO03_03280 [Hadesarchaea archaeon]|nr:MAG: hypothetical protein DSO03_03280 [Hadesarchaea archaeon]
MDTKWGMGILAILGGILLLIGPFLLSFTTTCKIEKLETKDEMVWVEDYPITYLCVLAGILALMAAALILWKPVIGNVGRLLLVLSLIFSAVSFSVALMQAGEDIGLESLKSGLGTGYDFGKGGVSFADLPVPLFDIVPEIGSYFIMAGIILIALATPWCLHKGKGG